MSATAKELSSRWYIRFFGRTLPTGLLNEESQVHKLNEETIFIRCRGSNGKLRNWETPVDEFTEEYVNRLIKETGVAYVGSRIDIYLQEGDAYPKLSRTIRAGG